MRNEKLPAQIQAELRQYFAANGLVTSVSIAKAVDINQSQVHRNLFDEPRRVSRTLRNLCEYAKIDVEMEAADPSTSAILMKALASVWDGTDEHARRLAELLFAHNRAGVRK